LKINKVLAQINNKEERNGFAGRRASGPLGPGAALPPFAHTYIHIHTYTSSIYIYIYTSRGIDMSILAFSYWFLNLADWSQYYIIPYVL